MIDHPKSFEDLGARYDLSRQVPVEVLQRALSTAINQVAPSIQGSALEIGVGTGQNLASVTSVRNLVGVDAARSPLHVAASRVKSGRFLQADGCSLPFIDEAFGIVLIARLLEHIPAWQKVISESYRVLQFGGSIIFLYSPGFVVNEPRKRMMQLLEESGWKLQRRGEGNRSTVERHLERRGLPIRYLNNPDWKWTREISMAEGLHLLEQRVQSVFWDVPDALFYNCLGLLKEEYSDDLLRTEQIEARIEFVLTRKDHASGR